MNYEKLLATRTHRMKASAIRELLKVTAKPGMISLGGGLPAPESFPLDIIPELTRRVLEKYGARSFQYGPTEGFQPLREALAGYLRKKGIHAEPDEIMITTGSQGFLEGIGKILISPGDSIAVEAPTYLGALQAFNAYEPNYLQIETDDDGVIPERLESVLKSNRVKFVYLIPTFQNPSGRTIPLNRRNQIADLSRKYNVILIEDDPYSDLRYRGSPVPAIKTLASDHVIYTGTFSKIFAPGLRLGFFVAPEFIRKWMALAKQGIDLHTSSYTQALAAEYITGGYLERQLPLIVDLYRPKQEMMLRALESCFPESFHWSKPEGGMFIWVEGPKGMDMEKVYHKAVERNVAFVPGKSFFSGNGDGMETMRLNFTNSRKEDIDKAIHILSEVIQSQ